MPGCLDGLRRLLKRRPAITVHPTADTDNDDFSNQVREAREATENREQNSDGKASEDTPSASIASLRSLWSPNDDLPVGYEGSHVNAGAGAADYITSETLARPSGALALARHSPLHIAHNDDQDTASFISDAGLSPEHHRVSSLPSWQEYEAKRRLNLESNYNRITGEIARSPKVNIRMQCIDIKTKGVNHGWLKRKVPKAKHPEDALDSYNGEWLVKSYKQPTLRKINFSKAYREFVYGNLLAWIAPEAAPKIRIAKVSDISCIASKIIHGFKELQPDNQQEFVKDAQHAMHKLLFQSILLGDRDFLVWDNFGFVEIKDPSGQVRKVFKNIDYDNCGYFTDLEAYHRGEFWLRASGIFGYILESVKIRNEINDGYGQTVYRTYLEGLMSEKLREEIDNYQTLSAEMLGEVVRLSSEKFFKCYPEACSSDGIKGMNKHLIYPNPLTATSDPIETLVLNITRSVALQLVQLKIWGLFITSIRSTFDCDSAAAFAKAHCQEVLDLKICRELNVKPRMINKFIDQLAPIFNKTYYQVYELEATVQAAYDEPRATNIERLIARNNYPAHSHASL